MLSLLQLARTTGAELGPDLDSTGVPRRPVVVIDADSTASSVDTRNAIANLRAATALRVAVTVDAEPVTDLVGAVDIVLAACGSTGPSVIATPDPPRAAAQLEARVAARPVASLSLTWLLRSSEHAPIRDALVQESAVFSALLGADEFRGWLANRNAPRPSDDAHRVSVQRYGDVLHVRLEREARRNAVDSHMRDALRDALLIAAADPDLGVELTGAGPSFSAGGDLDEFGTATDTGRAHLVRVEGGVAAVFESIRDRVTARVHGACSGSGIELPAFAARVVAAPHSRFALPEVSMGLIPGAGGSASITRRIGRHRTLWWAITGEWIDAPTALSWGLVDAVE